MTFTKWFGIFMVCRSSKEHKNRVWSFWWNDWGKHSDSDLHEWSWTTSTHIHLDQEEWSCRTEVRKGEDTHLQQDPFWGPWRVSLSSSQQDWSTGLSCCVCRGFMWVFLEINFKIRNRMANNSLCILWCDEWTTWTTWICSLWNEIHFYGNEMLILCKYSIFFQIAQRKQQFHFLMIVLLPWATQWLWPAAVMPTHQWISTPGLRWVSPLQ